MFNPQDQRGKRQQVFVSSIEALANILAFMTAFLVTPEIHTRTVGWVVSYASLRYGPGFEDLITFGWFVATALLVFFGARATLATAIIAAGVAFAIRFV